MESVEVDAGRAVWAGFTATLVMSLFMALAPTVGLPRTDIELMIASLFDAPTLDHTTGTLFLGLCEHFLTGMVILPLLYAYAFYPRVKGTPTVKGLKWGFFLFLLLELIILPVMGFGFFGLKAPFPLGRMAESLFMHLTYGLVLGLILGRQDVIGEKPPREIETPPGAIERSTRVGNY